MTAEVYHAISVSAAVELNLFNVTCADCNGSFQCWEPSRGMMVHCMFCAFALSGWWSSHSLTVTAYRDHADVVVFAYYAAGFPLLPLLLLALMLFQQQCSCSQNWLPSV